MRGKFFWLGATVVASGWALPAWGQFVQLPTIRTFSVDTAVMVPDRGGAYLGGVSRQRSMRFRQGLPLNPWGGVPLRTHRGVSGQVVVTATVHDLAARDEAIRAAARAARDESLRGPQVSRHQRNVQRRAARIARAARQAARTP